MAAKIYQEIHRKLELEDAHVELQDAVNPLRVRVILLGRGRAPPDGANPELPQNPDPRTRAAVYRLLLISAAAQKGERRGGPRYERRGGGELGDRRMASD